MYNCLHTVLHAHVEKVFFFLLILPNPGSSLYPGRLWDVLGCQWGCLVKLSEGLGCASSGITPSHIVISQQYIYTPFGYMCFSQKHDTVMLSNSSNDTQP